MAKTSRSKNEIDKETLYQKIMPTSIRPSVESDNEDFSDTVKPRNPVFNSPAAAHVESALQLSDGVNIPSDNHSTVLVNVMEKLVVDRLDSAFTKFKCCRCDRCRKDVAAIALNKLPPRYVVTEQEKLTLLEALADSQDVATAIIQAIIQVRSNPRH